MATSGEWCIVENKKIIKQQKRREENKKWEELQQQCPHIMMPVRVNRIKRKLNIDGLDDKLLSDDWINLQINGWKYVKVIKSDSPELEVDEVADDTNTLNHITEQNKILPLNNGWGDYVMFTSVV